MLGGGVASADCCGSMPPADSGRLAFSTLFFHSSVNCFEVSVSTPPGNCFLMLSGTLPQIACLAHASPFCRPSPVLSMFCHAGASGFIMCAEAPPRPCCATMYSSLALGSRPYVFLNQL